MAWSVAAFLRSATLLVMGVLIGLSPAHRAYAKDKTAKQFLQAIYASYMGPNADGVRWRGPKSGLYFDQALTKLIAKDIKESHGEVGRIEADPFVDAQDFDIASVKIEVLGEDTERAKAVASFVNLSQPVKVTFDLVNTPQGWRIADITWLGRKESFASLLSGPLVAM